MKSILVGAVLVAFAAISTGANALPVGRSNSDVQVNSDVVLVKGGHGHGRGHGHMGRGGRGHHYGWYRGRGHHYGWWRGRHRGW